MSPEARALAALHVPEKTRPGDMWHCARIGLVWLFLGYHKNGRKIQSYTHVALYHWGDPCLRVRPHDMRDNDPNCTTFDPFNPPGRGEKWDYVGNMFEMMPYTALTGHPPYQRGFTAFNEQ